jgi:hypothetical protein
MIGERRKLQDELHCFHTCDRDGQGMYHAQERCEMHAQFLSENLKGKDHVGNVGVDGRIKLKLISKK